MVLNYILVGCPCSIANNQATDSIRLQIWTEDLWYLMGHCAHLLLMIRHSKVCEVFLPSPCSLFTLCNSPVLVSNFSGSSTPRATLESPVFSRRCSHRDFNFVLSARATLQEGICCKKKKFVYVTFHYCVNGAIHSSLLIYLCFILIERNHAEE